LRRTIEADARAWAESLARAFNDEGRAVAGGWPGTVSEARHRVSRCSASRPDLQVTQDELDALTRHAYVFAKKAWAERADPTPSDGS